MNNSKVSILIPVYGVEKYIERCARSVFEQTYDNMEIIFGDDCSPDHSIEIMQKVLEDYPARKNQVRIRKHVTNCGLAAVRNTLIAAATGDFICHVDSDDWIDKDMVKSFVEKQKEEDSDIVSCGIKTHKKNGVVTTEAVTDDNPQRYAARIIGRSYSTNIWGRLIRLSLYRDNNLSIDEAISNSEDYQIAPQLFYFSHRIATINDVYYHYNRMNETSYSAGRSLSNDMQLWQSFAILKEKFQDKGEMFNESFKIGEIRIISWSLKHLNRLDKRDEYFKSLMKRLSTIDKRYYKYVDLPSRIELTLKNESLICKFLDIKDRLVRRGRLSEKG